MLWTFTTVTTTVNFTGEETNVGASLQTTLSFGTVDSIQSLSGLSGTVAGNAGEGLTASISQSNLLSQGSDGQFSVTDNSITNISFGPGGGIVPFSISGLLTNATEKDTITLGDDLGPVPDGLLDIVQGALGTVSAAYSNAISSVGSNAAQPTNSQLSQNAMEDDGPAAYIYTFSIIPSDPGYTPSLSDPLDPGWATVGLGGGDISGSNEVATHPDFVK